MKTITLTQDELDIIIDALNYQKRSYEHEAKNREANEWDASTLKEQIKENRDIIVKLKEA